MGFLGRLGKKKAAAAADAEAEAPTMTTTTTTKAPIIMVEDVEAEEEATIERQDSTSSKKSLEPDGIKKTMESRDPEEIQPVASTGSKPDAPATGTLATAATPEPRDPEGSHPHEIITISQPDADESPMSPPDTPRAFMASPRNSATDFLDAIGKTLSNVCMLGGGARPMEDDFEEDDDDDSSRASGNTSSTLGQESVRTSEAAAEIVAVPEEAVAAETEVAAKALPALLEEEEVEETEKSAEAKDDLPSLADEAIVADEEHDATAVQPEAGDDTPVATSEDAAPKAKKSLFGWCAACKGASGTTAAVAVGAAAAVGVGAAAVAVTHDSEETVAAPEVETQEADAEKVQAEPVEEEAPVEEESPENQEAKAEAEEAPEIPAVTSALSDQGSKRSKRSRASIISAAMSRFSRKSAVPEEVGGTDFNNLEEIPGMVRFMSHTERIERGFEVLLRDFSGYMRQCGQCEIKNYDYEATADEVASAEEKQETSSVVHEEEAKAIVPDEAVAVIPEEITTEREDAEERQDEEAAEGRDDDQPAEAIEKDNSVSVPTVASKQSKASRFSLRSILGKKSNSILVADQSSCVPDEVNHIDAVPSKALSNLSRASADDSDDMGPQPQEAYQADPTKPPRMQRQIAAE